MMRLAEMYDPKHFRERKRIFWYLIKAGANMAAKDKAGATVLDYSRTGSARSFRAFIRREYRRRVRA
jgi:hypothetical protein